MKKSNRILAILLFLGITASSIGSAVANNIVQMDVKKSSSNALDLTMYTSNQYDGNIIVRKKSDNKYVVLIPKTSSSINTPDFHAVKDIVTNIDVKSVNDTGEGYTKVTVITQRPVNIHTKTVKSAPISAEQQSYRSLLNVANTPKANSIKPIPVKTMPINTITVDAPKIALPVVSSQNINPKKMELLSNNDIGKIETTPVRKKLVINVNNKDNSTQLKTNKKPTSFVKELKDDIITNNIDKQPNTVENSIPKQIETDKKTDLKVPLMTKIKNKLSNYTLSQISLQIPAQIPAPLVMVLLPLLAIIIVFNMIKASVEKSRDLRSAFVNKVKKQNGVTITKKYSDITSDESLNWKEKYEKYNEAVQNPDKYNQEKLEKVKRAKYSFIKDNEKRNNLEKMINPIVEQTEDLVKSEESSISKNIAKTIKLKGFAKFHGMKATHRSKIDSDDIFEDNLKLGSKQQNIDLGFSMLHKNLRKFEDGNLSVFDVKEKNKSIRELKRAEDLKRQDYAVSSLDEYFSIVDKDVENKKAMKEHTIKMISTPAEKATKDKIKKNLESLDTTIKMPRAYSSARGINLSKAFANPFSSQKDSDIKMISMPKEEPQDAQQLIVNSKYDIDENHGFMMVTLNEKSALLGKANDNFVVLKEYDRVVSMPIQVRRDKENVYMVKSEDFKSLVEIKDDTVGVLINL